MPILALDNTQIGTTIYGQPSFLSANERAIDQFRSTTKKLKFISSYRGKTISGKNSLEISRF